MDIIIKPMESDSEIRGKAYVHWKAWQDAYPGLVDQAYLDNLTIEKCTDIAFRWLDNLLIAKENDKVIGFVGYGVCGDDPLAGEIFSIYILKEYYDKKSVMRSCAPHLRSCPIIKKFMFGFWKAMAGRYGSMKDVVFNLTEPGNRLNWVRQIQKLEWSYTMTDELPL